MMKPIGAAILKKSPEYQYIFPNKAQDFLLPTKREMPSHVRGPSRESCRGQWRYWSIVWEFKRHMVEKPAGEGGEVEVLGDEASVLQVIVWEVFQYVGKEFEWELPESFHDCLLMLSESRDVLEENGL